MADCDEPWLARSLCSKHHAQARRGVIPMPPTLKEIGLVKPVEKKTCKVTWCSRVVSKSGHCNAHYVRSRRGLDMDQPLRITVQRGFYAREYHDGFQYILSVPAAHERCRYLWGSASQYPCIECGNFAKYWAYDGTDPEGRLGESRPSATDGSSSFVWYSLYPEFYIPLCQQCHIKRDGAARKKELSEYRQLKHDTKLTIEEMRERLLLGV